MTKRLTLAAAAKVARKEASTLRRAALRGTLTAEQVTERGQAIWYTTAEDVQRYLENRPEWIKRRDACAEKLAREERTARTETNE